MAENKLDLYLADELIRIAKGGKFSTSVDDLLAMASKIQPAKDALIKPQDAFTAGVAINQKNYMAVEKGRLPVLPEAFSTSDINNILNRERNLQATYQDNDTLNQLDTYNRVKAAFESPEVITNIDNVTKDFSMLSKEQQDKLLSSLNKAEILNMTSAINDVIGYNLSNLDLNDEKNKKMIKDMLLYRSQYSKREWKIGDVLEAAYVDNIPFYRREVAKDYKGAYIHKEGYENHLELAKNTRYLTDVESAKLGIAVAATAFSLMPIGLAGNVVTKSPLIANAIRLVPKDTWVRLGVGAAAGKVLTEAKDYVLDTYVFEYLNKKQPTLSDLVTGTYETQRFSKEEMEDIKRFTSDLIYGLTIGGAFAKPIKALYKMTNWQYFSSLLAGEATLSVVGNNLFEEYGWKGMFPLFAASVILAPQTIVGNAKFLGRVGQYTIAEGSFALRDLLALGSKGVKNITNKLWNVTELGTKMNDEFVEDMDKNIGKMIVNVKENPNLKSEKTILSMLESTQEEYDALKLGLKPKVKPLLDVEDNNIINRISSKVNDDGTLTIEYSLKKVVPTELLREEYFNRTLQTASTLTDPRLYNEVKNLINQMRLSKGMMIANETREYLNVVNMIRQLPKLEGEERDKMIDTVLDKIVTGVTNLNYHTDNIISQLRFSEALEDYINQFNKKGILKHIWDSIVWSHFIFNPFRGTKLDAILRESPGFVDSLAGALQKRLNTLRKYILKPLNGRERDILDNLLNIRDTLGQNLNSIEDIAKVDAALASKVNEKVFRAYKETTKVFDFMGNHLAKRAAAEFERRGAKVIFTKSGYRLVKPFKTTSKNGKIKVVDLETGVKRYVDQDRIKDIDYKLFLLNGYAPRIPAGQINVTILNKEGKKLHEYRGFRTETEAGVFAKYLDRLSPAQAEPGTQIIIHHFSKSPLPVGRKNKMIQLLDSDSTIDDLDELADTLTATGASREEIKEIINNMDDKSVLEYAQVIRKSKLTKVLMPRMQKRKFRPIKEENIPKPGASKEEIENYRKLVDRQRREIENYLVDRMDIEDSWRLYTKQFTDSIGINRLKNEYTRQFIRKFGDYLERDLAGNVNWTRFNSRFDDLDAATKAAARHIQGQLRRIHAMPTEMEKRVDNWYTSIKEKYYRTLTETYNPDITKRLMLSSNISRTFNNMTTAVFGGMKLTAELMFYLLQAFQAVPTLILNPDVALEALTKSIIHTTKTLLRQLPMLRESKLLQDADLDILKLSGIFENVNIESDMLMLQITKFLAKPMVWGELTQRLVAANVALARGKQLGLAGKELSKFVYDYGTTYALDMSNYSKRAISEGFLKWNIGLFSRYFTQTAELFWAKIPPDKRMALGLTLYGLFGIEGIPYFGDIKSLYERYSGFISMWGANMLLNIHDLEKEAINTPPEELVEKAYPDMSPAEKKELVRRIKEDNEFQKEARKEYMKTDVREILEPAKDWFNFLNRLFYKEGALQSLAGRLAYNDFITQKLKDRTFTTPLVFLTIFEEGGRYGINLLKYVTLSLLTLGSPSEKRTDAWNKLHYDGLKAVGKMSPNMFDLIQGFALAKNLITQKDFDDFEAWLGETITTPSGTSIKRWEYADWSDVARLLTGYGYPELYHFKEKDYHKGIILKSFQEMARGNAEKFVELTKLGNIEEAYKHDLIFFETCRTLYGDSIAARLYYNSYVNHIKKLINSEWLTLDEMYKNPVKQLEVNDFFDNLMGLKYPDGSDTEFKE